MQVDGRKEAGESCTSEVMTTWCCIQQSTTEIVMEKPELSPRVQLCMDPSVCLCICDGHLSSRVVFLLAYRLKKLKVDKGSLISSTNAQRLIEIDFSH